MTNDDQKNQENQKKPEKKFGGFFRKQEDEGGGQKGGIDSPATRHRMNPFRTTPSPLSSCPWEEKQNEEKKEGDE